MIDSRSIPQTDEQRAIAARAAARRLSLSSEQQQLRQRYEEVMQWANPPWDPISKRVNPRPETADAAHDGKPIAHFDKVGPALLRWSVLEMGEPPIFRVEAKHVVPPLPDSDENKEATNRYVYNIERQQAQNHATQMENLTDEWIVASNFHRTMLWGSWAKRAFGVSILRSGWDPIDKLPTIELLENPSQVYRGWTKLYGRRMLSWVNVAEAVSPEEAEFRFGVTFPRDGNGNISWSSWTGAMETGSMENRPEQQSSLGNMVWIEEYWELIREEGKANKVQVAFIIGGRVVEMPEPYPWNRLPFHVLENEHIPTYQHGKSTAEVMIPINQMYDNMLDAAARVIDFGSGPRYKGINLAHADDEVDVPAPFKLMPLREGEDIQQLDTHVDLFPLQLHSNELKEIKYESTGLTPIAEGMSPNAQTSGRAMTAEWRAVELPLHSALLTMTPEVLDIFRNWWDFAEAYSPEAKAIGKGYRRFRIKWKPVDVRDRTEIALELIQLGQNHYLDPETIIEELGFENGDEIMARIKAYMTDPIYNPLGYQQYLVLKEIAQRIQMQEQQLQANQQQQPPPQQPGQGAPQGAPGMAQSAPSANQPAPGQGPVSEAQNQPGMSPGGGGLGLNIGLLSRTPLESGSGSQIVGSLPVGPGQGK